MDQQYFPTLGAIQDHYKNIEITPNEGEQTVDILDQHGDNFIDEFYFRGEVELEQRQVKPVQELDHQICDLIPEDLNFIDEQFFGDVQGTFAKEAFKPV